jgi:hypothetical protein
MLELSGIELDCPVAYSGTNYHPSTFIYDNGNDNSHKSNENRNEMTWGDVLVCKVMHIPDHTSLLKWYLDARLKAPWLPVNLLSC